MRKPWLVTSRIGLALLVAACATPDGASHSSRDVIASNSHPYVAASGAHLVIDAEDPATGIHVWDTDLVMGIQPCPNRPRCVITPIGTFAEIGPTDSVMINRFRLQGSRHGGTTTVFAHADSCEGPCYRYTYDHSGVSELEWLDADRYFTLSREGVFVAQGVRYRIGGHSD